MQGLQTLMTNLDATLLDLKGTVEGMRPAYNQALQLISTLNASSSPGQKNNLVFYGVDPDPLELQMESEPEFCRDVLETRIKMVFREHLHISRDMPFTQVRDNRWYMPAAATLCRCIAWKCPTTSAAATPSRWWWASRA